MKKLFLVTCMIFFTSSAFAQYTPYSTVQSEGGGGTTSRTDMRAWERQQEQIEERAQMRRQMEEEQRQIERMQQQQQRVRYVPAGSDPNPAPNVMR